MTGLIQRLVAHFFRRFLARYAVLVSLAGLLVTGLAAWVIATQWNINSDFKALLPQDSEAAAAMSEVGDRIGSGSALFVVIDSPSTEANLAFAEVYAEKLRELPSVALAHYHNDKTFFEKNQLLYLEAEDIATIRTRLSEKIREEKKRANPLFVSLGSPKKSASDEELIAVDDLAHKYDDQAHQQYKEYLISDDGYSATIVVRFVESSTNLLATNALLDRVRELGEQLDPTSFHPEMTVDFGGGLVNRQKEYDSIVGDVQLSALFTILGLFFVIALYFRRLRAIALVLSPLVMGVVWTLALAFLIYGELTTVTVFIFAILLGLSIDFSIHLLSGYDHERLAGRDPVEALVACYNSTGRATTIGAFTTFVTFVVLAFAEFRGLSQFGVVASIGVLCSLTAMVVVLPALILSFDRLRSFTPRPLEARRMSEVFNRWAQPKTIARTSPWMIALGLTLTGFALAFIPTVEFEENFRKIGQIEFPWKKPADDQTSGARKQAQNRGKAAARRIFRQARQIRETIEPDSFVMDREQRNIGAKYSSAVGSQQTSTPSILLFDDARSAERVYRYMQRKMREGELSTIKAAAAIYAFMPGTAEEQRERKEEIEAIRALLDREGTAFLSDAQKRRVQELREKLDAQPFDIYALPLWTKRLFKEAGPTARPPAEGEEFAFEYAIYINEKIDQMVGSEARRFLADMVKVREETGEDFRIGSQSFVYVAMLDEIKHDGAQMMLYALLAVLLILVVFFRSPARAAVAMIPLAVGAVWTFGLAGFLGVKLDFFNVIIIPVIIGLGVDDGIHFYHRYLAAGRGSIASTLRHVGSAVTMTSITSAIGFGGLAVTEQAGLQSIGYLAILGIGSTWLATVTLMPATLWLAERTGLAFIAAPPRAADEDVRGA